MVQDILSSWPEDKLAAHVSLEDIISASQMVTPSVSKGDLQKYQGMQNEYCGHLEKKKGWLLLQYNYLSGARHTSSREGDLIIRVYPMVFRQAVLFRLDCLSINYANLNKPSTSMMRRSSLLLRTTQHSRRCAFFPTKLITISPIFHVFSVLFGPTTHFLVDFWFSFEYLIQIIDI